MTQLTPRQRVQVNAALALIHAHGHDPRSVQQSAHRHIGRRIGAKSAYERALKDFMDGRPELAGEIRHALHLIDASDDATVARYGEAVDQYNQTGNPAAFSAIASTFQADSVALAVREGRLSQTDAASPAAFDSVIDGFAADAAGSAPVQNVTTFGNVREKSSGNVRAGFSGKDAAPGAAYQGMSREDVRAAAHHDRYPTEAPVSKQGWTPSDQYG